MAKVRLENIRKPRRPIVLQLDRSAASIVINRKRIAETRQGERRVKLERVVVPDSIRVPVNGLSKPIDEELLKCAEVATAIKARKVRAVADKPPLAQRRASLAERRAAVAAKRAEAEKTAPSQAEKTETETTKGPSNRSRKSSTKGRS